MEVYFPIEFNAPKANNDIFGITKQQLSDGLNKSFACHDLLSSFVMNMLLEKLDDDETSADTQQMIDIVSSFKYCCNKYGIRIIQSYLKEIYDKMKSIVLYGTDNDITDIALDFISSIVELICNQFEQKNGINVGYFDAERKENDGNGEIDNINCIGWGTFLEAFINDFRAEIKIPDAKLARMSSKIIITISNTNYKAFEIVMKYLWNDINDKYNQTKENKELISQKHALLEVMSSILVGLDEMNDIDVKTIEIKKYYQIFTVILTDNKESQQIDFNSKCIAMITLSYLCDIKALLKQMEIEQIVVMIYNEFKGQFLLQNDDADVKMDDVDNNNKLAQYREIIYNSLCRISDKNPKIVLDKFVNPVTKYLGFDANTNDKIQDIKSLKILIDCVAPLCLQNEYIWHYVLQIIIDPLYLCLLQTIQKNDNMNQSALLSIKSCFNTMSIILDYDKPKIVNDEDFKSNENDKLIDKFLTGLIIEFPYDKLNGKDKCENQLFLIINRIISKLINNSSQEIQQKFAKFSMDDINKLMSNNNKNVNKFNQYKFLIELISIASCNNLPNNDNLLKFIIDLQKYLLSLTNNISIKMMNYYFECIGCILNKSDPKIIINPYLNSNEFENVLKSIENNKQITVCLYYIIWIIKSLSVRCHRDKENKKMELLVEFLCKCLLSENKKIGQIASFGFDIIMNQSKLILNKKNKCKISSLYKQKFFIQTIKFIMTGLSQEDNKQKSQQIYLLLAVCHLMKNVPNSVLTSHLSQLLPLMIESFKSSLENLKISILFLFEVLFKSNIQSMVPFIEVIIPILLELTKYKKSPKVRIAALNCLILLGKLEYSVLHKVTKKVTRSLLNVLDDDKKEVRVIAVECRNQWYLIGE